jgi:hypothetical protein
LRPLFLSAGSRCFVVVFGSFQLGLARRELFAERVEIHLGVARLCEHAARLLFFLDVVLDHFGQHRHLGIEVIVIGR